MWPLFDVPTTLPPHGRTGVWHPRAHPGHQTVSSTLPLTASRVSLLRMKSSHRAVRGVHPSAAQDRMPVICVGAVATGTRAVRRTPLFSPALGAADAADVAPQTKLSASRRPKGGRAMFPAGGGWSRRPGWPPPPLTIQPVRLGKDRPPEIFTVRCAGHGEPRVVRPRAARAWGREGTRLDRVGWVGGLVQGRASSFGGGRNFYLTYQQSQTKVSN